MNAIAVPRLLQTACCVVAVICCGGCRSATPPARAHDRDQNPAYAEITDDKSPSPFKSYDAELLRAVRNRWYDLLAERPKAFQKQGKVVAFFRLNASGAVKNLKVKETTVDETLTLLCLKAILDPAPYDSWPPGMRLMVDKDYREITFTFFYGGDPRELEKPQYSN